MKKSKHRRKCNMGLLSDLFDVDPETEKDIKDVIKAITVIALVVGGAGAAGGSLDLPFDDEKED